jgi:hypothetical protein
MNGLGILSSDFATPALRQAFHGLTFQSQLTPRIYIDDPFGPVNQSLIGSVVKPQITLHSKLGNQVIQPWGTPQTWIFPVAAIAAIGLLVGIGYALGRRRR